MRPSAAIGLVVKGTRLAYATGSLTCRNLCAAACFRGRFDRKIAIPRPDANLVSPSSRCGSVVSCTNKTVWVSGGQGERRLVGGATGSHPEVWPRGLIQVPPAGRVVHRCVRLLLTYYRPCCVVTMFQSPEIQLSTLPFPGTAYHRHQLKQPTRRWVTKGGCARAGAREEARTAEGID
jgi:hypothetical protein